MWCWLFGCVNRLARFAVVSSTGSVSSRRSRGERRGRRSKGARSARVRAQCARARAGRHPADRNCHCCAGAIIRPNAGALLSSKATRLTRRALCSEVREVRASERSSERSLGYGAGCLVVRIVWIVCGALRGGQFDWIGVMARRHGAPVESSSADVEATMALRDIAPLLLEIHPHNH